MMKQDRFIFEFKRRKTSEDDDGHEENAASKTTIEKLRWTGILFPASKNGSRRCAALENVDVDMDAGIQNEIAGDGTQVHDGDANMTNGSSYSTVRVPCISSSLSSSTDADAQQGDISMEVDSEYYLNTSLARSVLAPPFTQATPIVSRDESDISPVPTHATQGSTVAFDTDASMLDESTPLIPTQPVDSQGMSPVSFLSFTANRQRCRFVVFFKNLSGSWHSYFINLSHLISTLT